MSGRAGATATLEAAAAPRGGPRARTAIPAARGPGLTIRLGSLSVPVVRPDGTAAIELEPGSRLGPLELRSVMWSGAAGPSAGAGIAGTTPGSAAPGAPAAPARMAASAPDRTGPIATGTDGPDLATQDAATRAPPSSASATTRAAAAASPADGAAPVGATPDGAAASAAGAAAEPPIAGLSLVTSISAPFVTGSAVFGLDPSGQATGQVRIDGSIGLPGMPVAALRYRSLAWPPGAPLPVPAVAVRRERLIVDLAGFSDLAGVELSGPGLAPIGEGRWSVALPAELQAAFGAAAAPTSPEAAAGADPMTVARARLAEAPSQRQALADPARAILESLLGVDLAAIGVHVDPPANDAAATVGARSFTIDSEAYFAAAAYGTDRPDLAALLARAVVQAVEGLSRIVDLDTPMADPAQKESSVQPAPAAAPGAPTALPAAATTPESAQLGPATAAGPEGASAAAPTAGEPTAAEAGGPTGEISPAEEGAPGAEAGPPGAGDVAVGEAPAEAAPPEGAPAEPAPAGAPIELIMPPPPAEPGPAEQARMGGVARGAGSAARSAAALPSAEETTAAARGAVTEPPAETAARAQAAVADALGARAQPSPEIVALCDRIRTSIRERRPVDEDDVKKTDSRKVAEQAGASLNSGIKSDSQRVEGSYAPLNNPPAGAPTLQPTAVQPPPATVAPPPIGAEGAAPDPIPAENLSLDADRDASDARVEESRINRPSSEPIQEPPFTTVREGQTELAGLAAEGPSRVAAQQQEAIGHAQQDMAALQLQAIEALNASRSATVGGVTTGQTKMVGSEEQQRQQISQQAQAIFSEAQTGVTSALAPLQANAMARWDAGIDRLSTEFHDSLARVRAWIDDRHSGVGGWFVSGWDSLTGLPSEITDEYSRAEREFGDGVCALLLDISSDVNTVIAAAEALIESARERIDKLFADLPDGLRDWATKEQEKFHSQLDGLHEQAAAARTSFVDGVSEKAVSAVAAVQAEVEQLREEAKGLIGKIADAIADFIDDPIRAIINGLLHLVGIPPASFWALVEKIGQVISDIADDPIGFINNLVDAVRQGFQQFFDNFGTHVLQGFWDWLFSGLGPVGVQLPKDMSVGSLITFALQVMGITWPNIRKILVKHIGEENVALIEQAWQLVSTLIEKGPSGILDMIKERLSPDVLLETILKAAIDYLIDALIKQVVVRVIGLLNPAGAIAQAIQLIYTVLKWIFQNAAKIFSLIETVVNALADVIAGNLSSVANAVEKALAMLIPIVIDFLAEWLGFGDLPIKIAEVIKSLQEQVLAVVDQIIGFLVEQAKKLLSALGFGGDDDKDKAKGAEDTELGKTVRFNVGVEPHSVFVQQSGSSAELMVASAQTPVTDKLAGWRAIAPSKWKKDQEKLKEVVALLDTADSLSSTANAEANQLAGEFAAEQAAAKPEEHTTPSDDALEGEEVTLASTLRQLFKAFDEKVDLSLIFANEIGACHQAAQADVREGVKAIGEATPELEDWAEVKSRLFTVKTRISGSLAAPMHAGTGGYSTDGQDYGKAGLIKALETPEKAPVRAKNPDTQQAYLVSQKRYLKVGADNAWVAAISALQDSILANSDPTDALKVAFLAKWAASVEPDEALVEAVQSSGGIVKFLQALAQAPVAEITVAVFQELWKTPVNKEFVKSRFRAVASTGAHEWVPTNLIPKVVERAATAEEAENLYLWVDMQNEMRTDTSWVIFSPTTYKTQELTPPGGATRTTLTGHVGAVGYRFQSDDDTRWLQGFQDPWHEKLRDQFWAGKTPAEVVTLMQAWTVQTVWQGGDASPATWTPYYVKQSEGGGPKTVADLGKDQADRYGQLIAQFESWKKEWVKGG